MIDVVIPVYNIEHRGYERLKLLLYTLEYQTFPFGEIFIVDGSNNKQARRVHEIAQEEKVNYIHTEMIQYNQPRLLNIGIRESNAIYIQISGVDFLFEKKFVESLTRKLNSKTFYISRTIDLPEKCEIGREKLLHYWKDLVKCGVLHAKSGDGIQTIYRDWLLRVHGFDQRFWGYAGMDNDLHTRAERDKMDVRWLEEENILHQWHKGGKYVVGTSAQAEKNWEMLKKDKSIARNPEQWGVK